MNNSPFINAAQLKNFDFSPWGGIEGFLKASQTGALGNHVVLKRLVPDLAHAVDMIAVGVASLPFDITEAETTSTTKAAKLPPPEPGKPREAQKADDEVFDSSEDWKNKLGGMPNPKRLIYLLASSLCGGAAYLIPTRTPKLIFDLQYAAPHTITPQIFREGLQYFDRASDQGQTARLNPKDLIYFWLPDSDIEIGPALNHPLGNATMDALTVFNLKNTMKIYGERGFVPITLLGAKGMPDAAERDKAEGFFDRLLRGGFDVLAKIVNSDALTLIRVGAGMDELKQSYLEIRRDAKESIADAFGIPPALFMSDNAYASEFIELRKQMYTSSRFVSIYNTIQEVMTEQLYKQYGKVMRFTPESLSVFQEDETKRSAALGQMVTAISTDPDAATFSMSVLGYDLDDVQQALLDGMIAKKEEEKQKLEKQMAEGKVDINDKPIPPQDEQDKQAQPPQFGRNGNKALELSADELKDLALWYSKAKAWHLKGKGVAVDWENKHLREEIAKPIRDKLADAKTEFDIMAAFKIDSTQPFDERESDIKALVAVIEKAIEATVEKI